MTDNKTDETPKATETAPEAKAAPKTETTAPAKTEAKAAPVAEAAAPVKAEAPKAAPAKKAPAKAAAKAAAPKAAPAKMAPARKVATAKPVAKKAVPEKATAKAAPAKTVAKAATASKPAAAKAAPKKVAATAEAVASAFQPDMFAALRDSIEVVVETNRTAVETAMELQETTTSFMQSRLAASAAVVDRIGCAGDLTEIADLQREYAQSAFEAWTTHFSVLGTTCQDVLTRGVELAAQRVNAASEQAREARWF